MKKNKKQKNKPHNIKTSVFISENQAEALFF